MSIERQLFDYWGWDGEPECITFYNVVLKVAIGNLRPGTEFESAKITQGQYNNSYIEFNTYIESADGFSTLVTRKFELHYYVGKEVKQEGECH